MDKLSKRLDNEIDWHYYGSPLKNKNVVQAYIDENYKDSVPVPLKNSMLENIVVPNTVHTGLILENMAATYVELKKINHPQTKKYKKELKTMIDELIKTTWVRISEDEGFFALPYQSPTYLGGGKYYLGINSSQL